ncbi:hypothetical protein C8R30_1492 [Nitrosomonas nitrosa]|uniref:Uncharacterized protein n=1 Tax=Nitrosomonas nitrosa TaxID=52442 RepID=A0A8H9D869_9PROT|nr:hypothetical protein [Nitrosomonas nitrosa]PTQ88846.1 hypothetical protein C8R30_1492 [Nitrosomonas nitrosa]CAE6482781.1 hypothetical protein NMYAN_10002 [Nitrosomonas nitrosa]
MIHRTQQLVFLFAIELENDHGYRWLSRASQELSDEIRVMHRAIISLREELEAIDFYNQRVNVRKNPELKVILAHNRPVMAFLPLSNISGKDKQIRHCEEHSDAAIQSTAPFIDASQELKICKTKNLL